MNPLASHLQLSESDRLVIDQYRRAKNTAVLTIFFTDVVGSTSAAEKLGENEYLRLKEVHDNLIRTIIERGSDGKVIKEIGDSFLAVYAEPSTAVERALEIQEALMENLPDLTSEGYELKVRMGLHMGQVSVEGRTTLDIFGRHVNRAARVMGMARGGQVLTTAPVWDNASGWLRDQQDVSVKSQRLGSVKLKGIDESVDIYEFYTDRVGSQGRPAALKDQRKGKSVMIAVAAVVAILFIGYFSGFFEVGKDAPVESRDVYYLDFDMSLLDRSNARVDSNRLKQQVLSEVLSVVYPDSVVTYEAAERLFAGRGEVFRPRPISETEYYRDVLAMAGVMTAEIELDSSGNALLNFFCRPFGPLNSGITVSLNDDDPLGELREFLLEFWIRKERAGADISVVDVKSKTLILRFTGGKGLRLQPGMELSVTRNFSFNEERDAYLRYLEDKMQYYQSSEDAKGFDAAQVEYDFVESRDYEKYMKGTVFIMGDYVGSVRIDEVFDSTASATILYQVPWAQPESGDRLTID